MSPVTSSVELISLSTTLSSSTESSFAVKVLNYELNRYDIAAEAAVAVDAVGCGGDDGGAVTASCFYSIGHLPPP